MLSTLVSLLITLLIIGIIFSVIWWIVSVIPWPAPLAWVGLVIKIVVALILLIWLISVLLPLTGGGLGHPYHLFS